LITLQQFENIFIKSLPTSLACPRQEKDGQREDLFSPSLEKRGQGRFSKYCPNSFFNKLFCTGVISTDMIECL
jgi:hypothetical protein